MDAAKVDDLPLAMAVALDETRDYELCEEIVRAALDLVTARKPQEFLKAQTLLLQASEELHILRSPFDCGRATGN